MKKMPERVASTAAALFLQAGFLLLLLQALQTTPARKVLTHEITLILPRLPAALPAPVARAPSAIPSAIRPEVTPPKSAAPSAAPSSSENPIVPPSAIQGFGQALNNCAPENYANLPDDQKANCTRPGAGVAVQQAPALLGAPSHVGDGEYWAAELAARNTPARVDCTHLENQGLAAGREATTVFVDPLCALKHLQRQFEH